MARNKTKIEFEGFNEVLARLKKLDGDVKGTMDKALTETHSVITKQAKEAISPHYLTGATEKSLVLHPDIEWEGSVGSVKTGFDIANGGLASIFLMYGTPRMRKDQKLYNAFFGTRTRKEIMQLQEDIFYEEIRRVDR